MFDARLLPILRRSLQPMVAQLHARRIQADHVTLLGFGFGVAGFATVAFGAFGLGIVFILLNRLCDGLDGELARKNGATDRGAFLDIALDFVFYALIPLGFALADPASNALAAAVLLSAFVGTGSSFLAFSVIAERRGLKANAYPSKGIYYLGGLTEGTETIAFLVLICLFPSWFAVLAYLFAAACVLTTLTRWWAGWRVFASQANPMG